MSRRASRVDDNHKHVVDQLRRHGFSVVDLSGVGGGVPDLAVGIQAQVKGGRLPFTILLEVKDGDKPPSARGLTPQQENFFRLYRGSAAIVYTANEAVALCMSIRRGKFAALNAQRFEERRPEQRPSG